MLQISFQHGRMSWVNFRNSVSCRIEWRIIRRERIVRFVRTELNFLFRVACDLMSPKQWFWGWPVDVLQCSSILFDTLQRFSAVFGKVFFSLWTRKFPTKNVFDSKLKLKKFLRMQKRPDFNKICPIKSSLPVASLQVESVCLWKVRLSLSRGEVSVWK